MSFYLNATTISSPVCKSFSLTTLLGFLDFKICAASKALLPVAIPRHAGDGNFELCARHCVCVAGLDITVSWRVCRSLTVTRLLGFRPWMMFAAPIAVTSVSRQYCVVPSRRILNLARSCAHKTGAGGMSALWLSGRGLLVPILLGFALTVLNCRPRG